ncbi:MAG: DUF368 domain-containing protein [Bacilli bacterium]|nr:DUF368 domain-containing protein [Bacilli bacterium]
MWYYIILFIKGTIIGLGKIIPGVSGSVIALSLGIYEEAILTFNNLFKAPKNNSKYLFTLGLGIVISVSLMSKVIIVALNSYYLIVICLILGLILGGFIPLYRQTFDKNITISGLIILTIVLIFNILLIKGTKSLLGIGNYKSFLANFILGMIEAITMIIPGISGTAVFMSLGVYDYIMIMFSNLTNLTYVLQNMTSFLALFLGLLTGIVLLFKTIDYLLKKHRQKTYYVIVAFAFSSILIVIKQIMQFECALIELLLSLPFIYLGYKGALLFEKIGSSKKSF